MDRYSIMNGTGCVIKDSISYGDLKNLIADEKIHITYLVCKHGDTTWRTVSDLILLDPTLKSQEPTYAGNKEISFQHDPKYEAQIKAHLEQLNHSLAAKDQPQKKSNYSFVFITVTVGLFILTCMQVVLSLTSNQKHSAIEEMQAKIGPEKASNDWKRSLISQSYRFNNDSTGQEWRLAPITYRKEYCDMMAEVMQNQKPGITGQFIFDSLQEFYTTSDEGVLSTKIVEAVALTVALYH